MIRADHIGVPAIGGFGNERPGLYGFESIGRKVLTDLIGTYLYVLMAKCSYYPPGAVAALIFPENGNYLMFHYNVFGFELVSVFIAPFIKATTADLQDFTYLLKWVLIADGIDKSIYG